MQIGDKLRLPERRCLDGGVGGNKVVQVETAEALVELGALLTDAQGRPRGFEARLASDKVAVLAAKPFRFEGLHLVVAVDAVAPAGSVHDARWIAPSPKAVKPLMDPDPSARREAAKDSWAGMVLLREEVRSPTGDILVPGLRPPQIGAVYGVLAHWKASDAVATVVMPTGTGKTETMLTLLAHERFGRLLVLVPTDPLRDQIARKFETFGRLRDLGVLAAGARNPVVGRLGRKPKTEAEARAFFERCNVVVSTVAALTGLPKEVSNVLAEVFDTLFIDEAHHVAAGTWAEVKGLFAGRPGKRIVQFTATPFREDGKLVDGKVVFRFPMRKAMEQGYFRKIRYVPVDEADEDRTDEDIARKALEQLRSDLDAGLDHVIMARTRSKKRAAEVQAVYERLDRSCRPTCIHSGLTKTELVAAKEALFRRHTRVIVCVDMLGEGFDFPALKIAALHDPHRSLAVTLQFVGRFTREAPDIGEATAIASLADPRMDDRIQALYAEDADWGTLLDDLSEGQTRSSVGRSEFLAGFAGSDDGLVSLRRIFPKMSTAVFRTRTTAWRPHKMEDGLGTHRTIRMGPCINQERRTVLALTEESQAVPWGDTKVVANTVWNLFLAHWDEAQGLLFINTSDNSAGLTALAEALTGGEVEHVQSEDVFKPFHGLTRMTLLNVGLKHRSNRFTRFSMLVGPDVAEGMSPSSVSGKSKTNVFVTGRARGRQVTLGASTKGRIWSYAKARDMSEWVEWCQTIGQKIRDPAIKGDAVLEGAMVPTPIDRRPDSVPLVVEWPDDILAKSEEAVLLDMGAGEQPLLHASLAPVANDVAEPLRFTLTLGSEVREFEVRLGPADKGATFVQTGGSAVHIRCGSRRALLTEWFNENPPCIVFADLSELEGNWHFATRQKPTLMPLRDEDLLDWPWPPPVDITRESHRKHPPTPNSLSVQTRVFHEIGRPEWQTASGFAYDIIFDDDDAGEAADIVAIGTDLTDVRIDLFHCKFSRVRTHNQNATMAAMWSAAR
jgi:superfamily II DNA or RNA helicase